ncbi:MAG: radical SAM protein [Nanoarchaeota archaeon]|nr:radical SAM protein [Nanoarchaeota archaeon]
MNILKVKYNAPYFCYINLTSKCNLRCKHCFGDYSIPKNNELSLDDWKKVITELKNSKVFFVNISGGEPTQSPYFKEFIKCLSKEGIHFILTTNGVFSNDIKKFIIRNREYLIGIKISLDGPDAESHGFLRLDSNNKKNPEIFKIVLENIFFFKKHKIPLTISSVLHKKNIKKIKRFQELIKEINPISWFISPIIPLGRANLNRTLSECYEYFNINFWDSLSNENKKRGIKTKLIDLPVIRGEKGLSAYECAGALNFCEIHSDGTVSPCTLCRICIPEKIIKFENIRKKSLKEIWNGNSFNKFRSYMNKGCEGCKMLPECNKCIAQSFRYFDNGDSPTPYCIKNSSLLGIKNIKKYKTILKDRFNINI